MAAELLLVLEASVVLWLPTPPLEEDEELPIVSPFSMLSEVMVRRWEP
jgi:hypothetical protein